MTTYDPAATARLIADARKQYECEDAQGYGMRAGTMHDLADQLEAAVSEVDRLNALALELGVRALLAEWEIDRMLDGRVEVELHVGQDPDDCDPPPAKIDHDVEAWRLANPDIRDDMPVYWIQ